MTIWDPWRSSFVPDLVDHSSTRPSSISYFLWRLLSHQIFVFHQITSLWSQSFHSKVTAPRLEWRLMGPFSCLWLVWHTKFCSACLKQSRSLSRTLCCRCPECFWQKVMSFVCYHFSCLFCLQRSGWRIRGWESPASLSVLYSWEGGENWVAITDPSCLSCFCAVLSYA